MVWQPPREGTWKVATYHWGGGWGLKMLKLQNLNCRVTKGLKQSESQTLYLQRQKTCEKHTKSPYVHFLLFSKVGF